MNYIKIYDQLIDRAKNRIINGYIEKHHIVPVSMGGSNRKENLVKLTGREHFIAHLLLWKIYKTGSMAAAVFLMSKSRGFRIHSREYEILRETHSKNTSILKSDKPSPKKGIKLPNDEDSIRLRSERRKGKGLGNAGFIGKHKEESLEKMRKIQQGHKPTNYKRVSVNGIEYNSATEAAKTVGLTYNSLIRRLREEKYTEYFYL